MRIDRSPRKFLLLGCLFGLATLSLAACGGGAAEDPSSAAAALDPAVDTSGEADPGAPSEEGAERSVDEADEAVDGGDEEPTAVASGLTGAPVPAPTAEAVEFDATQTTGGGRFPPLNDPRAVLPADATWLDSETLVLGAIQNGDARAYPVYMMTFHHVANDVLGGQPYLVSF